VGAPGARVRSRSGLNQSLFEYGHTNASVSNGDRPIFGDIDEPGDVIRIPLCGDSFFDGVRAEVWLFNLAGNDFHRFDIFVADESNPTEALDPSAAQGPIWSREWAAGSSTFSASTDDTSGSFRAAMGGV